MTCSDSKNQPHPERSSEAFFGRRKGLKLKPRQEALFDSLLPRLVLDLDTPCNNLNELAALFDHAPDRLQLEIGFGGGEHLIRQAELFPKTGFIGVEPFVNGMAKALVAVDEGSYGNIRLYDDDATRVLDWLPEASLDQIDLMYPDPWPKKRHWKRRFVSQKNLARFARVLKDGGIFRFASDIDTYVNWTLNHCHNQGDFVWLANSANDWRTPYENWIVTRYEKKAKREGRQSSYLSFQRCTR